MAETATIERGPVYPLTELHGDGVIVGNFIRPVNFRLPDFCDDCPLKERLGCPQISKGKVEHFNIGPRNPRGIMDMTYSTNIAGMTTDVLLLNDASDDTIEPIVLEEMRIFNDPFSVEHEEAASLALGAIHRRFDRCETPVNGAGWLRRKIGKIDLRCGTGTKTVSEYNMAMARMPMGVRVVYDATELLDASNIVVGPSTRDKMLELSERVRARQAAGIHLKEPASNPGAIKACHEAIMSSLRVAAE